ncbi:MAG: glycosyltransferase involved in cell wall biosynthesis [Halioglobus sp.]|jgi:glycosyltransferase involved in cell wall biosynthesis
MSFTGRLGIVGPLPPPAGGMATQTRQLVDLMRAEGVLVVLVQTNKPYWPNKIESIKGIRAVFRLIPYLREVWKMVGSVDVVHLMANSGWSWQLFSAPTVWIGWLRKTPVIVNYRGGEAQSYFAESFSRVKPTLAKAATIVAPSGYLKKVFADFGLETHVIPNIVDLERFKPREERLDEGASFFRLIITRNLEAIYGIDTAIRAIGLAREQIPDIQLQIAGNGPQRAELENLVAALGLEQHVNFVGRIGAGQIVEFYQSANVMLNPTTVDNMPNSVLEALACGVPVVTTNVGGIPYIVEHEETALMVPVGDFQKMAEHVVRLYNSPELVQKLIGNGLAAVKPYSWPEVKHQWLSAYESTVVQR